jgi:hypothetical protein
MLKTTSSTPLKIKLQIFSPCFKGWLKTGSTQQGSNSNQEMITLMGTVAGTGK